MPSLIEAVRDRDAAAVRRLIGHKLDIEERNEVGETPLLVAIASDQFEIAIILIDGGADIFAWGRYGDTAGRFAESSRVRPDSAEGMARARVIELMKARGFPSPAPHPDTILALVAAGEWPPSAATSH